jgi:hypothetical protein
LKPIAAGQIPSVFFLAVVPYRASLTGTPVARSTREAQFTGPYLFATITLPFVRSSVYPNPLRSKWPSSFWPPRSKRMFSLTPS